MKHYLSLAATAILLSACGTWHTSDVNRASGTVARAATNPSSIIVSTGSIPQPYDTLGEVNVTVRKATAFDSDPTPAKANAAIQEEAAQLGATHVINAHYGEVNIGFWSWGTMEAGGTAVAVKH